MSSRTAVTTTVAFTSIQWDIWVEAMAASLWHLILKGVHVSNSLHSMFCSAVSDPHEDNACSHVPPADRPGATCLHLTRPSPDLAHPLNVLQSTVTSKADILCLAQRSSCPILSSADGL